VRPARGEAHVWRRPTERYLLACLRPSFKSGRLSLLVRGAFSARDKTPLVRVEGRLNQHKYIEILHNHLLPFVEARHGGTSNFKPLEDNCGPRRARAVRFYLDLHGLERVHWAPQSPDMNPIENVWSVLQRRQRARLTPPTTLDMLCIALCEEWDRLPDSLFAGLSEGMPRWVGALSVASGHSTKYQVNRNKQLLEATFPRPDVDWLTCFLGGMANPIVNFWNPSVHVRKHDLIYFALSTLCMHQPGRRRRRQNPGFLSHSRACMHVLPSKKEPAADNGQCRKIHERLWSFSLHTLTFCNAVSVYMPPRAMYPSPMAFNRDFGWATVERLSRDWVLGILVW